MSIRSPKPITRIGTYSARQKQRATDALDDRLSRAQVRFQVARYAHGLRAEGDSFRVIVRRLALAIENGLLPARALCSHESVRALVAQWEAGERSVADYVEDPRTGRHLVTDPRLVAEIKQAVRLQNYGSMRRLHHTITTEARRLGVPVPSYDTVKRLVHTQGRAARAVAAYGTRSAQLEAFPHSTIPARFAHDVWVLDELDAPFYARVFDPDTEEWVSARPTVITIVDQRTSVCVAHWVADPARRRDPLTNRIMHAGFDAADVLGTLLTAACRELATPGTAKFAGCLPQSLRWDNHATHGSLRPILTELGERAAFQIGSFFEAVRDLPASSFGEWEELPVDEQAAAAGMDATVSSFDGIYVPRLPRYRPINRGKIERKIGFLKQLLRDLPHHIDRVVPIDRLGGDLKSHRDVLAGSGERTHRRDPIDVRRLPTIAECRSFVDGRVHYYNHEHVSRLTGVTRAAMYALHKPPRPRKGSDLLAALETRTAYVTGDGIVHHHAGVATAFAYAVPNAFILPLDTEVTYKADPLLRVIFAYVEGRHYALPPKIEWAAAPGRAEEVARTSAVLARFHAGEAISARAASFDGQHGPGATKTDAVRAKAELDRQRREARQEQPTTPATPATSTPPPLALVRPFAYRSRLEHLKPSAEPPPPPPPPAGETRRDA